MKELICTASDGARLAYAAAGEGEALVCLHGAGESKELWEKTGWLEALAQHYTVITPDLRGFGHSDVFRDEEHYALARVLDDIRCVTAACGAAEYRLFGHSYGATIAFQAVHAGLPVVRAVMASGSMGPGFFEETCVREHAEYEMLAQAKRNGTLETLSQYSPEERAFIAGEDMEKFSALFGAWSRWPTVTPEALHGRASLYSGTKDFNAEAVENTTLKKEALARCGIDTMCFDGLDHDGLLTECAACRAWVLSHLA